MSANVILSSIMISGSVLYLAEMSRRKSEPFERVGALFLIEYAIFNLIGDVTPAGTMQVALQVVFGMATLWTMIIWIRLIRDYRTRTNPPLR